MPIMPTDKIDGKTIARLHFRVPLQHGEAFVHAYENELLAQLKKCGLHEAEETFTSPLADVFVRLFCAESPQELKAIATLLAADEAWLESLRSLGATCGNAGPDGLLPYALDLYSAPLGPGRVIGAVHGMGTWRTYGAAEGLVSSFVRSIVQGKDGHLWFATYGGGSGILMDARYRCIPRATVWLTTRLGMFLSIPTARCGWAQSGA
jgi:hypothetical protein